MSINKKSPDAFYRLGNEFYEKGDFRTAISYYDQAIGLDSSNNKYYYNRGLAKACLEEYDGALEDFRKVLELKENFVEAYYLIGLCFEYKQMIDEAIKEYNKALKLNPEFKDAQNRIELCKSKVTNQNRSNYSEIIEQVKDLEKSGQHHEALVILEKALRDNPDNIHLLFFRRIIGTKIDISLRCEKVCGLRELRETFDRLVLTPLRFADDPIYQVPIAQTSKGILLYGPPGCGKTLFVRTLAKELGIVLIEIVLSDVLNLYAGESEKRLTEVFNRAKEIAKSGTAVLLFIDEVDALGYTRNMTPETNEASWNRHLIATFLGLFNELQGISNIIVVGATNRPWTVDEALKRPGRLGSAIIYCAPPDEQVREDMFRLYSRDTPGCDELDFTKLAEITQWFSGDDIRSVCRDVHFEIARKRKKYEQIDAYAITEDYIKQIKEKSPQVLSWMRKIDKTYFEGQIEDYELDKQLKVDLARLRTLELPVLEATEQKSRQTYVS